jgi:hypothetical protein
MALTDYSGLTINNPSTGIQFTKVTDSSADWSLVSNNTYFYDKADKLVHYKDSTGIIQDVFRSLPAVQSVVSAATVTPTAANDLVKITAQAVSLSIAAPTGTWSEGQSLMISIKDDGTARAITFDTNYRAIGVILPTTTTATKTTYLGIIYNSTDTKWDVIGVTTQA